MESGDEGTRMADASTETNDSGKEAEASSKSASDVVASLTGKHGSAETALAKVIEENFKLREQRRELKAKAAPEGAVILQGEEASLWKTYRELGKPDEIRTALQDRDQIKATLAKQTRDSNVSEAGKIHGFDSDALLDLWGTDDIEITQTTGKDGKSAKQASVKGADGKLVPFPDFIAQKWPKLAAKLKADSTGDTPTSRQPPPKNPNLPRANADPALPRVPRPNLL